MPHRTLFAMPPMARQMAFAFAAGTMVFAGATSALADVRAGVTAWEAGDYARAIGEWRPLAVNGDADAQFNIGQAYKLGRGVPQDLNEAVNWFRRAADHGHLQSEDNLGLVLYELGQKAEALPWLQRSSARGEPRAQYVLAAELFNGERISRDWPRAYALMKRASDAGLQRASAALVQMDQHIPLEQRQQGLAMAETMERSEGQARMTAMTASTPSAAPRAPTIVPTALPPSQPGVSYAPPPVSAPTMSAPTAGPISSMPVTVASLPPSAVPGHSGPSDGGEIGPGLSASMGNHAPTNVTVHQGIPPSARGQVHAGIPPSANVPPVPTASVRRPVPTASVPTPTPAARRAVPAAAAAGAWRIQLGAFGERARAVALWSRLSARLGDAQPVYTTAGSVTRLQAGPYASRSTAQSACAAVRGAADCIVVSR